MRSLIHFQKQKSNNCLTCSLRLFFPSNSCFPPQPKWSFKRSKSEHVTLSLKFYLDFSLSLKTKTTKSDLSPLDAPFFPHTLAFGLFLPATLVFLKLFHLSPRRCSPSRLPDLKHYFVSPLGNSYTVFRCKPKHHWPRKGFTDTNKVDVTSTV